MSVSGKIYTIIAISALPILSLLLLAFALFAFQLASQMNHSMTEGMAATEKAFDFYRRQSRAYAATVANNAVVQRELLASIPNAGPILRVMDEFRKSTEIDRITVHNRNGAVVARVHDRTNIGTIETLLPHIRLALSEGKSTSFLAFTEDGMVLQTSVPIFFEKEVVGISTAGYVLDHRLALKIFELTRVHLFFIGNSRLIATSLGDIVPPPGDAEKDPQYDYGEFNRDSSIVRTVSLWSPSRGVEGRGLTAP